MTGLFAGRVKPDGSGPVGFGTVERTRKIPDPTRLDPTRFERF